MSGCFSLNTKLVDLWQSKKVPICMLETKEPRKPRNAIKTFLFCYASRDNQSMSSHLTRTHTCLYSFSSLCLLNFVLKLFSLMPVNHLVFFGTHNTNILQDLKNECAKSNQREMQMWMLRKSWSRRIPEWLHQKSQLEQSQSIIHPCRGHWVTQFKLSLTLSDKMKKKALGIRLDHWQVLSGNIPPPTIPLL